jgi:Protein-glutamine gamma-glutamyltransferase
MSSLINRYSSQQESTYQARSDKDVLYSPAGIRIPVGSDFFSSSRQAFLDRLRQLGLYPFVTITQDKNTLPTSTQLTLSRELVDQWPADFDTTTLCERFHLNSRHSNDDLEREIILALMISPVSFDFPSFEELASSIRVRINIVRGAEKTALAFDTRAAERPDDCWTYGENSGFTLLPGKSLISSLQRATQPEKTGKLYSFSCYRATEYVILLGIAEELSVCNPELFAKLQHQWEQRAIKSAEFHEVFLREYGTETKPLPLRYFVPGDRTWFRNPDDHSSDISGYEGSWVMYLGNGLFTNFWRRDDPFTLTSKCVELYHWRNAVYPNPVGELQIDEAEVSRLVRTSLADPEETARILRIMLRHREPAGVYVDGGCIDNTREYPKCLCPISSDLILPHH